MDEELSDEELEELAEILLRYEHPRKKFRRIETIETDLL